MEQLANQNKDINKGSGPHSTVQDLHWAAKP